MDERQVKQPTSPIEVDESKLEAACPRCGRPVVWQQAASGKMAAVNPRPLGFLDAAGVPHEGRVIHAFTCRPAPAPPAEPAPGRAARKGPPRRRT